MFACKKFRDYVYGKPTIVETDQQPLVSIIKKPIHTAPACVQRMLLSLQGYDITLVHKKGKYMYLADSLSKARVNKVPKSQSDAFEVMSVSYISTAHLEKLRKHTREDEVLQTLSALIQRGWSSRDSQLQPAILPI